MQQFVTLSKQALRDQISEPTRVVSPLLFGIVFTVVFSFAFGEVPAEWLMRFFAAQLSLVVLLAAQMSLSQSLDSERQDFIYNLLRTYPVRASAWYWAKVSALTITCLIMTIPLGLMGILIHGLDFSSLANQQVIGPVALATFGLTNLGVVLATLTMQSQGRQVLYALLFFPLCAPVAIALTQCLLCALGASADPEMFRSWLGLLGGFSVIYGAIGSVLFAELIYGD